MRTENPFSLAKQKSNDIFEQLETVKKQSPGIKHLKQMDLDELAKRYSVESNDLERMFPS
jgi:hypothetical protein